MGVLVEEPKVVGEQAHGSVEHVSKHGSVMFCTGFAVIAQQAEQYIGNVQKQVRGLLAAPLILYNMGTMRLVSEEKFAAAKSRDMVEIFCDACNVIFLSPKHDVHSKMSKRGWDKKRYCSGKCSASGQRKPLNKCKECGKDAHIKFCSKLCGLVFRHRELGHVQRSCENCGTMTWNDRFCGRLCFNLHRESSYLQDWKAGKESGLTPSGAVVETVRRYILGKYENKCSQCGWCEVNKYNRTIPVQVEHIDGDYRNCSEGNLTILCPNCHSLTPTYMTLNRGKGRDVNGVRRRGQSSKPAAYYKERTFESFA